MVMDNIRSSLSLQAMITKPTVDRIMEATDIVEVIGEFVQLKKRGANYVGPFAVC